MAGGNGLEERLAAAAGGCAGLDMLVLFGSRARGQGHARSDVDLGVLAPGLSAAARQDLETALAHAAGRPVDLVQLHAAPPLLRFQIARDGRLLWARAPHLWPEWKARAMLDWWDWKPIAERMHRAAARRLADQVARGPA